MKIRALLAIRALNIGGAERQFLELVKKIDRDKFDLCVVTFRDGVLDPEIAADRSIRFVNLRETGRIGIGTFRRFAQVIDEVKPEVMYAFLVDMSVFASIAVLLARFRTRLVWGIFGSEPNFRESARHFRLLFWAQQLFEWRVSLVTSDAFRGLKFFRDYGFRLRRSAVIFSGTDIRRFRRDAEMRRAFRERHHLADDEIAVGICSRLVHMKGYPVLAKSARQLLQEEPRLRFFAVGYGDDAIRAECVGLLGDQASRFVWLGRQAQPETCLSGWDVYCSSSIYGEGFSNSIIEAMASELPCVVTDVGDAAIQVGQTGVVVAPDNVAALTNGLRAMIRDPNRVARGARARERVIANFTAERMVSRTEQALAAVVRGDDIAETQVPA